jgi:hypothetical protein
MARAQALGKGHIPLEVPLLGPWADMCLRFSSKAVKPLTDLYKMDGDFSGQLDVEAYLKFICDHYKVTILDIREAELMMMAVEQLPVVLGHVVFDNMVVDH